MFLDDLGWELLVGTGGFPGPCLEEGVLGSFWVGAAFGGFKLSQKRSEVAPTLGVPWGKGFWAILGGSCIWGL